MSLKANYFKLGLFVIGAIAAGIIVLIIIGSGRWFQKRITIETYFNESVQGLDIGSKLKYRGVAIGEVTRIGFTYNKYQLDRPMAERARYVLVEAQLEPRLLGGRAGAGDLTSTESAATGSRARPAGAPRAARHHRDELPRSRLHGSAADDAADRLDAGFHLHPERALDGHRNRQCGKRDHGAPAQARHRGHARQPEQADGHGERADRVGRHQGDLRPGVARAGQAGDDARQYRFEEAVERGSRAARGGAREQCRAQEGARQPVVPEAAGRDAGGDCARADTRRRPEPRQERAESLADAGSPRPHPRRRRSRPRRRRSRTCARSPTTCAT